MLIGRRDIGGVADDIAAVGGDVISPAVDGVADIGAGDDCVAGAADGERAAAAVALVVVRITAAPCV